MIVTYLRSSSYTTHTWCPHQFFLAYTLGLKQKENLKANKGNVVHKVMEWLAHKKLCEQNGRTWFKDDDFGKIYLSQCEIGLLTAKAFKLYRDRTPELWWKHQDLLDCREWVDKALAFNNGQYDPRNQKIVVPELRFDIPIPHDWAKYRYELPNGEVLEGQLALKGTMDLVTEIEPGVLELTDYKTGRRWDWATDEEKTYSKLCVDYQLRMYYYAVATLFPKVKQVLATIYYINTGGPYTVVFHKHDLKLTEQMLRRKFNSIRNDLKPRKKVSWKCKSLCSFGPKGGTFVLPDGTDTGLTKCEFFQQQLSKKTADEILLEFGDISKVSAYGDGGGRKAKA